MKLFSWLPFGRVPEIDPEELHELVKAKRVQLLDVRTRGEFDRGHIEGAIHLPVTSLAGRIGDLPLRKDQPVVAICLSAHRSIPAVRALREAGFDASQLRGGMNAWRRSRLPEQPTN